MNNKQLANLRRLADEATPGPWEAARMAYQYGVFADNNCVAVCGPSQPEFSDQADAELIAAARTAVPQLLDALAAMTQRAEAAKRERDAWKQQADDERTRMRHALAITHQRAEAAEAKLAAIPWDELHAVHMRATNKNLHDWLTVTDWLSRNTPEQQEAQP